ncbi:guanylate kinase [Mycoplasmopsis columbinasalis]|uniref:Guanylate kinase n=1 Tax=Mycoplasmopsis columbinasalis TaxID=114880 RepID=A0A449B9W9_9BACT|nr:guanylate kinase [Mycoplasmopsis columbinasalis]VEU77989.1 guanylate kinase [Mycoplasmopsis columbinasalis]
MPEKKPIIIFTGPSGVGKGTIEKVLFAHKELKLAFSISATTRSPRVGEQHGVDYFFVDKNTFEQYLANNGVIEFSYHFNNYYGTLYSEIERIHAQNHIPFLEIETIGARKILDNPQNLEKYNIITFFVSPPSFADLEKRIINRNTETPEVMKIRLEKAKQEMEEKIYFKYQIVNDVPERAAAEIREIILKEINNA